MARVHRIGNEGFRWGESGEAHLYPADASEDAIIKAYSAAVAEGLAAGEPIEGDTERQVARVIGGRLGLVQKDAGQGLCIAWFPFDGDDDEDDQFAAQLAALAPGGAKAEDIHLTLLYLGEMDDAETDWDEYIQKIKAVTCLTAGRFPALEGCVSGLGRFVGQDDTDVFIALVDVPHLGEFRHCLKNELLCNGALPYTAACLQEGHGFVPHFTLGYFPRSHASPAPLAETIPFCLESLTVAAGGDRECFPLYTSEDEPDAVAAPYWAARDASTNVIAFLNSWSDWVTTAGGQTSGVNEDGSSFSREEGVAFMEQWLREEGVAKAGRMFSKRNLDAMQAAHDAMGDAHAKLGELLARGKPTEDDDTKKTRQLPEDDGSEGDLQYLVKSGDDEKRYTFGPLYAPNRKDAHREYIKDDPLQQAQWEYVRECVESGSNRINLQHGDLGDIQVGEWVDIVTWPYETTAKMIQADGSTQEVTLPAGTVYMGVVWDEDAYPLVKKGKINGYSLGGRAIKVRGTEDFEAMGWKTSKATGKHKFQDDGDGKCKTCGDAADAPQHVDEGPDANDDTTDAAKAVVAILEAAGADVLRRREREEQLLDRLAERTEKDRATLTEALDVARALASRPEPPAPDIHVHVPEQNVTVHPSGILLPDDE